MSATEKPVGGQGESAQRVRDSAGPVAELAAASTAAPAEPPPTAAPAGPASLSRPRSTSVLLAALFSLVCLVLLRPFPFALSLEARAVQALSFAASVGLRSALGVGMVLAGLSALWGLSRLRRWPRDAQGRGRLQAFFGFSLVQALLQGAANLWLLWTFRFGVKAPPMVREAQGLQGSEFALMVGEAGAPWFYALLALDLLGWLLALLALCTCWGLVPRKTRRAAAILVDAALAVAMAVATLYLPLVPAENAGGDVRQASVRLAVTTAFALRALRYLVPLALRVLERVGFVAMVAGRHLVAKKSGFLTAISMLSLLAVSFSSCALSTTLSVMGGFRDDLRGKILSNQAHLVVEGPRGKLRGWREALRGVRAQPEVVAATPYVEGEVMLTSASNLAGAAVRGIDPKSAEAVLGLARTLTEGRLGLLAAQSTDEGSAGAPAAADTASPDAVAPSDATALPGATAPTAGAVARPDSAASADKRAAADPSARDAAPNAFWSGDAVDFDALSADTKALPGIIVGRELARSLRLTVGDQLTMVSPFGDLGPSGPMPRSRSFRVAGVFYSGMYEFDMKQTYVELQAAQSFFDLGEEVSGVEARLRDPERARDVAAALRAARGGSSRKAAIGKGAKILSWQDRNANLFGALELEKLAMFITLGVAILVAGFCVFGTLTLMVQEKAKEVAIVRAMGAKRERVVRIFLLEGALLGLWGAALGLGLGFVVCFVAQHYGVSLNPEVYYIDQLPVHVDPLEFLTVGVAAVAVCTLSTLFPATSAGRTAPCENLRYE